LRPSAESKTRKSAGARKKIEWRIAGSEKRSNPIRYSLLPIRFIQLLETKNAFRRPGGHGGAAAPDPIPNSAVKRSSANGTSSQDAGE
jgi:hypothetical protein